METAQKIVMEFVEKAGVETGVEFRLLDLVSEMGELSKEVLKGTNYGKNVFAGDDEWSLELGDVLFSLICLANTTGVDLREALNMVLDKYEKRFVDKGNISSL